MQIPSTPWCETDRSLNLVGKSPNTHIINNQHIKRIKMNTGSASFLESRRNTQVQGKHKGAQQNLYFF